MTSTTETTTISTSGKGANVEDIHDENLLREMWQSTEDPDAKRQIRSRMYKLREERLKDFYGREGHDILANILKPLSDEGMEGSMEGTREKTVTSTRSQIVDGQETAESTTVYAKQIVNKVLDSSGDNVVNTIVTTTTTTSGGKQDAGNVTKSRITSKDRSSQMQEIKSQQRASPKRNVSASEIIKPLSKKSSVDSDISVSRVTQSNNVKNKSMTNGVVSKRQQTTTTVTSGTGGGSGGGKMTTTRTTVSTSVASSGRGGNELDNKSVSHTRNFQQAEFSSTTMSSMTMSSTMSSSSGGVLVTSSSSSSRAGKEISSTQKSSHCGGGSTTTISSSSMRTIMSGETSPGMTSLTQRDSFVDNENQTGGGEKLEVGKVLIKELSSSATGNEFSATAQHRNSMTKAQSTLSSASSGRERRAKDTKADANLINGVSTDGDINSSGKKTTITSSSGTARRGGSRKSFTQNEINDKTSSSISPKSNRSSSSNRSPSGSFTTGVNTTNTGATTTLASTTVGKSETSSEAQEKVCRRANKLSRESSPKSRACSRRQQGTDENLQSSSQLQQQQQQNITSPKTTRTPSKTRISVEKQPAPVKGTSTNVKVALTKDEPDKTTKSTEEKIMRELDILDSYLSQRSASIDEGNREDGSSPTVKMNGSHGEERMVKKSDKNFSLSTTAATTKTAPVDVMEAGLEPPFTRTAYKYNCPGDDHDHSPDKSPERNADERKRSPEKGRPMLGAKVDIDNLEDEIITDEVTTATSKRAVASERARSTSQKVPSSPSGGKSDKSGKTKRTSSQSPEKAKRNTSSRTDDTEGEVRESLVSSSKANTLGTSTNPSQDTSRGRRTGTVTSKTTSTSRRKDASESNIKREKLMSNSHGGSKTGNERNTTISQPTMTKEQKYEADILSRPSVFAAKRATAVTSQKPDPNPRLRKDSESSPERDVATSNIFSRVSSSQRTTTTGSTVGADRMRERSRFEQHDAHQADDELDEEDPFSPPKRFTASSKYLESPGAVLKAKSLFETKAQEAAKDRSSGELGSRVSTKQKLTVSEKAALFEARSRGERVSISSGSTHSLDEKTADNVAHGDDSVGDQKHITRKVPEASERAFSMERRVSPGMSITQKDIIQQVGASRGTTPSKEVQPEVKTKIESGHKGVESERERSTRTRGKQSRKEMTTTTTSKQSSKVEEKEKPSSSPTSLRKSDDARGKSPSRQSKPERISTRKSTTRADSPERPKEESDGKIITQSSERTQLKDNNTKAQRRVIAGESKGEESSEKYIRKRESRTKIDKQSEKSEDTSELRRKDSRGISGLSKITSENQPRRALQDIEQKNIESRENIINDSQRKEVISTNQTTLAELKSTNVVKATMRQTESAVYSQETCSKTFQVDDVKGPSVESTRSERKPETITSSKVCKRASKSPERSDLLIRGSICETTTATTTSITAERRRSSNSIDRKVEAIMANFKQTTIPTTNASQALTNRMTTAELNAVDEMDDLGELEALLDKATDYDERSKIRGRIRLLKRKATLDKRAGGDSPETKDSAASTVTGTSNTTTSSERRATKENKITSRKSSSELMTDHRVSSRKGRRSSVDKENIHEDKSRDSRSSSPQKTDRQSPARRRSSVEGYDTQRVKETHQRKSAERSTQRTESRSNSGKISSRDVTSKVNNEQAKQERVRKTEKDLVEIDSVEEQRRKLTSETSGLLSTRKYSRDHELQTERRDEQTVQRMIQDQDLYSSRRSSTNLEEDKIDIESIRRSVGRTGMTSRLKETDEENRREKSPERSSSKTSSRAASPQRSEIPISARMKRDRSFSPPKTIPKDTIFPMEAVEATREEQIGEKSETAVVVTNEATTTKNVSSRQQSSDIVSEDSKLGKTSCKQSSDIVSEDSKLGKTSRKQSSDIPSEDSKPVKSSHRQSSNIPSEDSKQGKTSRKHSSDMLSEDSKQVKTSRPVSVTRGDSSKNINVKSQSSPTEQVTPQNDGGVSQRKRSTDETLSSKSSRSNAYTRKGSSKELTSKSSRMQDTETLTRDNTSKRDTSVETQPADQKTKSVASAKQEIATDSVSVTQGVTENRSLKKEVDSSTTTTITSSQAVSSSSRAQETITTEPKEKPRSIPSSGGSASMTTRRTGSTTTSAQKTNTPAAKGKTSTTERVQSTDLVTSSYGIGPVDDDGTPLFGLRALRKIKQVQEQMETTSESPSKATDQQTASTTSANTSQGATSTIAINNITCSSSQESPTSVTGNLQNLRSNDMYGLRALRKQTTTNKTTSSDNDATQRPPSSTSSSPSTGGKNSRSTANVMTSRTTTSNEKFNSNSSTSADERVTAQTFSDGMEKDGLETSDGVSSIVMESVSTSSAVSTSNDARKASSPKSILKKTSSFSSSASRKNSAGGVDKEEQASTVASEVPIPKSVKEETPTDKSSSNVTSSSTGRTSSTTASRRDSSTTNSRRESSTTTSRRDSSTSSASATAERRKTSSRKTSHDDESWRRQRSSSPSPKQVASSSTASSIATFSRGKVGRSSVREMSKRFEGSEEPTLKSSSSTTAISSSEMRSTSGPGRESPTFARGTRGESPSRIPLSIKSTTPSASPIPGGNEVGKETTENIKNSGMTAVSSEMQSFQAGDASGDGQVCIQSSRQQKYQQHFETSGSSMSSTAIQQSRVVTTSSTRSATRNSGRSFLTDQSPIQNLEDVIDRMRGEDPELMKPFPDQDEQSEVTTITSSTSHGRNLLNKFIGAQVIMQAVEPLLQTQKVSMSSSLEQRGGEDVETETDPSKLKEMLENCDEEEERERIQRRIQSLGESSSVEIVEERRSSSTQLTQQSSTACESGDQECLVSSDSGGRISESSTSVDVTGELMPLILGQLQSSLDNFSASASTSVVGGGGAGACATSSSHNIVGSQYHQLSHSSSHNSPHISNNSAKSSGNSNKSSSASSSVGSSSNNIGACIANGEASAGNNSSNSVISGSAGSSGGLEQRGGGGEEESSASSEECLFDSGTESGEDLSTNASNPPGIGTADPAQPSISSTASAAAAQLASVVDSQLPSQYGHVSAEFSSFIQGLKNSLKRSANKDNPLVSYYHSGTSPSSSSQDPGLSSGKVEFSGNNTLGSQNSVSSQSHLLSGENNPISNPSSTTNPLQPNSASGEIQRIFDEPALLGSEQSRNSNPLSSVDSPIVKGESDSGLVQQVDTVLTLLRDSLLQDPSCLGKISGNPDISACDISKGKELIALIDRLKSSLSAEDRENDKENSFPQNPSQVRQVSSVNPASVPTSSEGLSDTGQSSMLGWAQPRPPDIVPFPVARSNSNPWVGDFIPANSQISRTTAGGTSGIDLSNQRMVEQRNIGFGGSNNNYTSGAAEQASSGIEEVPWKIRLAKRRSHPRSHTVGVTQEELAQARRLFEESTGFRLEDREQTQHGNLPQQNQSVYSNMQDLSSLGDSESFNSSSACTTSSNSNNNNNLSNINNYSQSDAAVVGTVPAYPAAPSYAGKREESTPLSPTSVLFPHDSTHQEGGIRSGGASLGSDKPREMVPTSGGCMSKPSWQRDVEKRLTSIPKPFVPFVKNATQFYEGYQPPPERRMTYASIDDSCPMLGGVVGSMKIKPFRTYSLDNNKPTSTHDDPSKSLFTPQETVQIAIHQAAIKKQMSEEEDRRKRRNSLTSSQLHGSKEVKQERDFTLGMPKPYSPPHAKKQQQQAVHPPQQQHRQVEQQIEANSYEIPTTPVQTLLQNEYSPLFQSGDSGFTEESGPESHSKFDQSAISYDSSPLNAPFLPPMPINSTNNVVSINGTSVPTRLNESSAAGSTITYTATPSASFMQQQQQQSPQRIENVQISLKELNTSEFPQLQIAITLNTNNGPTADSVSVTGVSTSSGGGQTTTFTAIPNVTATSVTTNLQLGTPTTSGNSSGGNTTRPLQMDMSSGSATYFSNDEGQQTAASISRAIRYKSKNERKKRMKRANTIDIPHPPGLVLHSNNDDDDSEMEDEEDSDTNYRLMKSSSGSGNIASAKAGPFSPKTDGDRKFLAFLEKNNALGDNGPRSSRPSYLAVNDRQWNSRFSNLKTSFESSSQGSSPSASPVPSPLRGPRSVSEMALAQGKGSGTFGENFSKPVWANTDKTQLPPQVRNKLHVFENKPFESQTCDLPSWRSPPPTTVPHHPNHFGGRFMSAMKQTVSTNALNQMKSGQSTRMYQRPVYSSHDNVAVTQKRIQFQGSSFDSKLREQQNVRKPMPVKPQLMQSVDQTPPMKMQPNSAKVVDGGVHMVHATAAALEAMKKSAFAPASFVPAQSVTVSQPATMEPFPPTKVSQEEKIDLPWAKRGPDSPSSQSRDPNAGRIQMSKAMFEQPAVMPQLPPTGIQQLPYQQIKLSPQESPNKYQISPNSTFMSGSPITNKPSPNSISSNDISPQQKLISYSQMGGSAEDFVPVVRPALRTFGVTQSFDEAFKRKLEQQITAGAVMYQEEAQSQDHFQLPVDNKSPYSTSPGASLPPQYDNIGHQGLSPMTTNSINGTNQEFQHSSGSAFARQIPVPEPSPGISPNSQDDIMEGNNSPIVTLDQEGMIAPVVAKVMRGPQQQRATNSNNRITSLNDDSRLTSARSNLRNILNQYQASSSSSLDSKSDASPPHPKPQSGNLLSLPPLTKSMSGDAILNNSQKPAAPTQHFLSQEEISRRPQLSLPSSQYNNQEPQRPILIPRQKSLSEFPKIANPPKIEPLTVETDMNRVQVPVKPVSKTVPNAPQSQQQQRAIHQQQQQSQAVQMQQQQQRATQQQSQAMLQQQARVQQHTQQQQHVASKATTRSYPDSLQRTSSGTSIFSRAKNLFFGSQDGGAVPPSTKLRPKLPSQPKITFPKQYEAQMSPDSADRKQRELATYFKQQQQQEFLQAAGLTGVESKAKKSAEAVSKSVSASSSKSVECEQSNMKASSSIISSSSVSSSSSSMASSSVSTATKIQTVSSSTIQSMSKPSVQASPMNKFKAMDQQANPGKQAGTPLFKFANDGLKASASSAKDMLLYWCQCRTREYENVKIDNFSSSWSDGLAFCAIIHHFYPDAFDFNSLNPRNRKYNFDLAFRTAEEKAGIYPLLDTEDMVAMGTRPDWKCVFTYVQSMYQKLKDM